jgi:hypothetical protein
MTQRQGIDSLPLLQEKYDYYDILSEKEIIKNVRSCLYAGR